MAFDSTNIWVGNTAGGGVTKMRASDGQVLSTFNTGCCPKGIAFDGVNVWIVGSPYLVVLRPSDGKVVYTTNDVQGGGAGIAFDGSNMWDAAYSVNQVSKF
jgi:hypothetical protein